MAMPAHPAFESMFRKWAKEYEVFTKWRFVNSSLGGGDWPPLAVSTIKARAGPKKGGKSPFTKGSGRNSQRSFLARDTRRGTLVASPRSYRMLDDTGSLKASFTIGSAGNSLTRGAGSITYAIGTSGGLGVIARAHQSGNIETNMPARKLLVMPTAAVLMKMKRAAEQAVRDMILSQPPGGA